MYQNRREQQCNTQFSDHASKDVPTDLEEQDSSVNILNEHGVGENGDLQSEDSMDYYSRMLKQEKCIDRTEHCMVRLRPF